MNATHHFNESPLGSAFVAAALIHIFLVFAIGFQLHNQASPANTIEVTLAQHRSDNAPKEADFIAQHNQQGSGTLQDAKEITHDRIALLEAPLFHDTDIPIPSEQKKRQEAQHQQQLVSIFKQNAEIVAKNKDEQGEQQQETPPKNAREIASLRAKLSQQRQLYSKIPRTLVLTAASARAADEASYLMQWIQWVEKIGNENYPEEARRKKIFGTIRLAVTLEKDGSVVSVEILQSSGQRVLDQAAVRIVRLAAPFEPFPITIKVNRIEVIRTWNFVPGNHFSTSG